MGFRFRIVLNFFFCEIFYQTDSPFWFRDWSGLHILFSRNGRFSQLNDRIVSFLFWGIETYPSTYTFRVEPRVCSQRHLNFRDFSWWVFIISIAHLGLLLDNRAKIISDMSATLLIRHFGVSQQTDNSPHLFLLAIGLQIQCRWSAMNGYLL